MNLKDRIKKIYNARKQDIKRLVRFTVAVAYGSTVFFATTQLLFILIYGG